MDNTSTASPTSPGAALDRETVSERVVAAVADATDTSPIDLTPPLFSVVDPEALDALVESIGTAPTDSMGRIEFTYCGCDVTVTGDGRVTITDGPEA